MASRLKLARAGAAVLGASVVMALSATVPAGADPTTGHVDGGTAGYPVNVTGFDGIRTSLIGFSLADGTKLGVYCVEIETSIDREHEMVEVPWDSFPNPESPFHANRAQINWVLHNGYPALDVDRLAELLAEEGAELTNGLSEREAITGTQAAVWHYSDDTDLDRSNPTPRHSDAAADVLALYDYLTGENNTGIGDQPTPALEISPTEAEGQAGELVGPFTVSTTGEIVELTKEVPAGVKLTDADGKPLSGKKITNGTEVYFKVPEDAKAGEANFGLQASAHLDTGRLFIGQDYANRPTQSLIVAEAEDTTLEAQAKATWTEAQAPPTTEQPAPQPKDELAETGASIFVPLLIGLVLVGAGGAALVLQRRRSRA